MNNSSINNSSINKSPINNSSINNSSINNLINTNNPDKKYEIFWYSYKNLITKYLTKDEKINIDIISKTLNDLKDIKKYNEIINIITDYIMQNHTFYYKIIKSKNCSDIILLYKKLRKWPYMCKINNEKIILFYNSYAYIFLKIAQKCALNYLNNNYNKILEIIINIDFLNILGTDIIKILDISLNNDFAFIVDNLKLFNDFDDYIYNIKNDYKLKPYTPNKYPGKKLCLFYKSFR